MSGDPRWPLLDLFPAVSALPRITLRDGPTPVEHLAPIHPRLWIKRDDLTAAPIGGNKVRSLEFLLGNVTEGDRIVTAGARGSTHALTTAVHANALGARTLVAWWPQEMNDVAREVSRRLDDEADRKPFPNAPFAVAWLQWRKWRRDHVIPAGGTSPLGILGHVNAALELAAQIRAGALPQPERIVVPLGTGGTAAGLALGLSLAGIRADLIAARVVPRIVGRRSRVRRLARHTARLIERAVGEPIAEAPLPRITVVESVYGGAYGRPLPGADRYAESLAALGIRMDPTYSAKAFVSAVRCAQESDTLFWLTFDSRWITSRTRDDRERLD